MPADQVSHRRTVPRVCLAGVALGAALLVGGGLWSALSKPRHVWSPEQAAEYSAAAAAAHAASDAHDHGDGDAHAAAEADVARQRFAKIATELENARFAKNKLGGLLTWIGLAATTAFGVGYLVSRSA